MPSCVKLVLFVVVVTMPPLHVAAQTSSEPKSQLGGVSDIFVKNLEAEGAAARPPLGLTDLQLVATEHFEVGTGKGWANGRTSQTPEGGRPFLGEYGPDTVQYINKELPPHELLFVSFDLYVMGTWDGSSRFWGPDLWEASLLDGRRLIRTTFTNCKPVNNDLQSYPDDFPCPPHTGWTGAAETSVLGYEHRFARSLPNPWLDAVYPVVIAVPHTSREVRLTMTGMYPDSADDQSWGIANFKLGVASLRPLAEAEMRQAWARLASPDSVMANTALWTLAATGDQAVRYAKAFYEAELNANNQPTYNAQSAKAWRVRRTRRLMRLIDSTEARSVLGQLAKINTGDSRYLPR